MSNLTNLPASDSEYWQIEGEDIDKNRTDLAKSENLICGQHEHYIDFGHREVRCKRCGVGFRFNAHEVEYKDGKLYLKSNNKPLW